MKPTSPCEGKISASGPIVLTANSMRNLAHFRRPLLAAFAAAGLDVVAMAPDDLGQAGAIAARRWPIRIDRGGTNPLTDFGTLLAYLRGYRALRPAAVLGFTPKANIYGGLAARLTGVPFIPNVSGLGTGFLKGGAVRRISLMLYRHAFARSPVVFFQNPDDRDAFIEQGLVAPRHAALLPGSGVDLEYFAFTPSSPSKVLRLLFVGRFLADKGLRELAAAVREVQRAGKRVEVTLVGATDPGNPSSIAEEEIFDWVARGLCSVVGMQDDVRPFIARADAVVLPSYREGLPRVLLEAAAMGRPLIATDVPGCREVAIDGLTGLLCEARNSTALAAAITRFADMAPSDRAAMGRSARALVEERFDEALVVKQYWDALARIGVAGVDATP